MPVLYDGNPAWPTPDVLWKMVDDSRREAVRYEPDLRLGPGEGGHRAQGAASNCRRCESVTLAGSPVTPECMEWFYKNVKQDLWVASGSGGTDVCTGFVGGAPRCRCTPARSRRASLGCAVYAFNERGEKVVNQVGELVVTEPMPSMPVCFWNDPDNKRYLDSYFEDIRASGATAISSGSTSAAAVSCSAARMPR